MEESQNIKNIEKVLECKIPIELASKYRGQDKFKHLSGKNIQNLLQFSPPFLRTENMVIFGDDALGSSSIGVGTVYPEDMEGHYNDTVYLAFAGRLMPSSATIHLAHYFPNTSPQAVEGENIRMDKEALNGGLLQPKKGGSKFYVETRVTKKKMALVLVETSIMFGKSRFGMIQNLRFVLTEKDSIYKAIIIPDVD
jgi:hypothetical protein